MEEKENKMVLTDKCKEEFEKYRLNYHSETELEIKGSGTLIWDDMSDSSKYGVYVDFFYSVGLYIEICRTPWGGKFYFTVDDSSDELEVFKTRPEARVKAIDKANELYNN